MPISIKMKPKKDNDGQYSPQTLINGYHPNSGDANIEIKDMESGAELSRSIRKIKFCAEVGEVIVAELEIYVGEIDIDGVKVVPRDDIRITPKEGDNQ